MSQRLKELLLTFSDLLTFPQNVPLTMAMVKTVCLTNGSPAARGCGVSLMNSPWQPLEAVQVGVFQ